MNYSLPIRAINNDTVPSNLHIKTYTLTQYITNIAHYKIKQVLGKLLNRGRKETFVHVSCIIKAKTVLAMYLKKQVPRGTEVHYDKIFVK